MRVVKKIAAGALAAVMVFSSIPFPTGAVHAEEAVQESAEAESEELAEETEADNEQEPVEPEAESERKQEPESAEASSVVKEEPETATGSMLEDAREEETQSAEDNREDDSVISLGSCGDNVTYVLNSEGVLTISGSGAIMSYSSASSVRWYSSRAFVKTVVIESGVTSIGDYAFSGCSSLTSISIPGSVTNVIKITRQKGFTLSKSFNKLQYN